MKKENDLTTELIQLYETERQKTKVLLTAIINICQVSIEQDNLKSVGLLALLQDHEQSKKQEQSKEEKQPEAKSKKGV